MLVHVILFGVVIAMGVALATLLRVCRRKIAVYQTALEQNQKRLDHHVSQFNIFLKSLPVLQGIITQPKNADRWTSRTLDEIRIMVHAEGGAFWKFRDGTQELDLDVDHGAGDAEKGSVRLDTVTEIGEAAVKRIPVIGVNNKGSSTVAIPLVVNGELRGVFRFLRRGEEPFTQREADLVNVFMRQLALALENQDMVRNREKFYLELVQALADALDSRDASTEGQTRRARRLARAIATELDMPEEFIYYLEFAALMHDIGKIVIDEQLLRKPGKLTPQEFEIIKKHPEFGHKILAPVAMLAPVAPMVLYHQEWYNGQGYPEGLSGEEIPLGARIVALLDAWSAMTSDRPWRKAMSSQEAITELKKGAGTQFDPKVVDAFLTAIQKLGTMA